MTGFGIIVWICQNAVINVGASFQKQVSNRLRVAGEVRSHAVIARKGEMQQRRAPPNRLRCCGGVGIEQSRNFLAPIKRGEQPDMAVRESVVGSQQLLDLRLPAFQKC